MLFGQEALGFLVELRLLIVEFSTKLCCVILADVTARVLRYDRQRPKNPCLRKAALVKQNKAIVDFQEEKKPRPMECRLSVEAIKDKDSFIEIPEGKELFDLE